MSGNDIDSLPMFEFKSFERDSVSGLVEVALCSMNPSLGRVFTVCNLRCSHHQGQITSEIGR
jgi:hypothetical protein